MVQSDLVTYRGGTIVILFLQAAIIVLLHYQSAYTIFYIRKERKCEFRKTNAH